MFCIPFSNAFSNMLLQEYKEKPDYARCVAIVASASLREMIKPGALAIISPIAVGIAFRIFGYYPEAKEVIVIRLQLQETCKSCCPPFSVNLEMSSGTVAVDLTKFLLFSSL
ncbi:uncharacterized protein LOC133735216 [Rosa rugosa]|uniref:uncharacterized protein LOC133735216 n=1 Tax=Rosa rugosa TaxID=74645 RepID=UPI002B411691|nr:uncharacterized protein LOC133735216 [Rosa rugosa]